MDALSVSPPTSCKQQQPRVRGHDHHVVEAFSPDDTIHNVELLMTLSPLEQLSTTPHNNALVTDDLRHGFRQVRKRCRLKSN